MPQAQQLSHHLILDILKRISFLQVSFFNAFIFAYCQIAETSMVMLVMLVIDHGTWKYQAYHR